MKKIIIIAFALFSLLTPLSADSNKVDKKAQLQKQLRHASIMIRHYRYWFSRSSNYSSMNGSYWDRVQLNMWKKKWLEIKKELDKYGK